MADSYFTTSLWPSVAEASAECGGDEIFLLFYRWIVFAATMSVDLLVFNVGS